MKRETGGRARYEEIALDLARRIATAELKEGSRILGRSSLAGTYQVSPETIRRSVAILYERGIVQAVAGSGIRVLSRYAAAEYLESVQARSGLEQGLRELRSLIRQRRQIDEQIETSLDRMLSQATTAFAIRQVDEVAIKPDSWAAGRSLGELRLRSRTGSTAVAVTRGESDSFSPPPDMQLEAGDVVTIIGSDEARGRARNLLESYVDPEL